MTRRRSVNRTGIDRIEGIPYHDAWVAYICLNCLSINYVKIGQVLLTPSYAFDECLWICESCGFIHSKESDIPFENWDENLRDTESKSAEFWITALPKSAEEWKVENRKLTPLKKLDFEKPALPLNSVPLKLASDSNKEFPKLVF